MPQKIKEYEAMVTEAPLWQERLTGVGYVSAEDALGNGSDRGLCYGEAG